MHCTVSITRSFSESFNDLWRALCRFTPFGAQHGPDDIAQLKEIVRQKLRPLADEMNSAIQHAATAMGLASIATRFSLDDALALVLERADLEIDFVGQSTSGSPSATKPTAGLLAALSGTSPRAFMSYSWDDEAHKEWVKSLAARLRSDGVDVSLDRWDTQPGDQLPAFMERSLAENDFVLVVCTPGYKERSDHRRGGVGYEGDIITAELLVRGDQRKFVPILRGPDWEASAPTWALGKHYVDLRGDPHSDRAYGELLNTILGRREGPPPLGASPGWKKQDEASAQAGSPSESATREITVSGGGVGTLIDHTGSGTALEVEAAPGQTAERIHVQGTGIGEIIVSTGPGTAKTVRSSGATASVSSVAVDQPAALAFGAMGKLVIVVCKRCKTQFHVTKVIQAFVGEAEPLVQARCPACGEVISI